MMRILLLGLTMLLASCANLNEGSTAVDRRGPEYLAATKWIGRDAIQEFEKNKEQGRLRLYGMNLHLEERFTVPGLEQKDIDRFVLTKTIDVEIIHEDVYPVIVGENGFNSDHCWAALDDFMTRYNQLVLSELRRMDNPLLQSAEMDSAN